MSEDQQIPDISLRDISIAQASAVVARGVRAALLDLAGENQQNRTILMSIFLYQLMENVREPNRMAAVFRLVAEDLDSRVKKEEP